jgi:hypothetical protein
LLRFVYCVSDWDSDKAQRVPKWDFDLLIRQKSYFDNELRHEGNSLSDMQSQFIVSRESDWRSQKDGISFPAEFAKIPKGNLRAFRSGHAKHDRRRIDPFGLPAR